MFELEVTESFELKFAKIYPDFTKDLVNLVDNLSPSEIKICMCIKMSYSNIQIKDYMKISDKFKTEIEHLSIDLVIQNESELKDLLKKL